MTSAKAHRILNEPRTLDEIFAKQNWWHNRLLAAEDRKARAEKTIESCCNNLGMRPVVEKIAHLMQFEIDGRVKRLDVAGPFGLGNETSIWAYDENEKAIGWLSFRPAYHEFLVLVNRSKNDGEYPPNSLGDINGFNHPDKPMPGSIRDLCLELEKQFVEVST